MGRRTEIVIIILMIACIAGTGFAIGHQRSVIADLRSDAVATLEKAIPLKDYRKKQQKEVKEILDAYEKKLGEVKTQEEADKLIADAKAEAKPIKTDAQLTKIEKKKAAEKAKKEAERKAREEAEEAARQAAAEEAARQAEEERQQSYSYSNSGSGSGSRSSSGSSGGSSGGSKSNAGSDGCVDPDADLI